VCSCLVVLKNWESFCCHINMKWCANHPLYVPPRQEFILESAVEELQSYIRENTEEAMEELQVDAAENNVEDNSILNHEDISSLLYSIKQDLDYGNYVEVWSLRLGWSEAGMISLIEPAWYNNTFVTSWLLKYTPSSMSLHRPPLVNLLALSSTSLYLHCNFT